MLKHLLIPCLLLLSGVSFAEDTPTFNNYLTYKVANNQPYNDPQTVFDCTNRIYAVIEASGLPYQPTDLTIKWLNPLGDQEERTDYTFHPTSDFSRVWAWLQLGGPTGATFFQAFDPAFGMESFIGEWQAKILINNKKIETIKFQIVC